VFDFAVTIGTQDEANCGEITVTEDGGEIRVRSASRTLQWPVMFHELTHKWEREAGIKLRDEDAPRNEVDRFAMAMYADFLRNDWKLPGE
jgi:hypothetical protein